MNITTERLLLRPVQHDDLDGFHRLQADPQVTQWTYGVFTANTRSALIGIQQAGTVQDVGAL